MIEEINMMLMARYVNLEFIYFVWYFTKHDLGCSAILHFLHTKFAVLLQTAQRRFLSTYTTM
jgi:hypothetical protein